MQIVRAAPHKPGRILRLLEHTFAQSDLPEAIRDSRLIEPLIWLRDIGVRLPARVQDQPASQVRRLIET
ncbi:MAG: AraC family transcriptional regulator, partial [Pseudomonadota bacterium]